MATDQLNDSKTSRTAERLRPELSEEVQGREPGFLDALLADAQVAAAYRGERQKFRSRLDGVGQALRLMLQTDAFLALAAYRLKKRLDALRIPVLPWLAHRLAIGSGHISISDAAVVHPGVFIPNGLVVVNGQAEIAAGAILLPWVTLSPLGNEVRGPTIGPFALIGSGAKIMGEIKIGANARVGTNAVVLNDVPPDTTVVGVPARPVTD
jgi:serine O-acetyltransferase